MAGYVPPSPSLYGEGLDATYSLGRFSVPLYFRQRDYDETSLRKENELMDDPNGICAFYVRRHLLRQFKDHTLPQLKALFNVLDIKVGKNKKEIVSSLQSHYNDKIRRGVQDAEVTVTQERVHDHELSDLIRAEVAAIGDLVASYGRNIFFTVVIRNLRAQLRKIWLRTVISLSACLNP